MGDNRIPSIGAAVTLRDRDGCPQPSRIDDVFCPTSNKHAPELTLQF